MPCCRVPLCSTYQSNDAWLSLLLHLAAGARPTPPLPLPEQLLPYPHILQNANNRLESPDWSGCQQKVFYTYLGEYLGSRRRKRPRRNTPTNLHTHTHKPCINKRIAWPNNGSRTKCGEHVPLSTHACPVATKTIACNKSILGRWSERGQQQDDERVKSGWLERWVDWY